HSVPLNHATLERLACPLDLSALPHPALPKHRQQDDPPVRGYPVRHAHRVAVQVEPQLSQLAIQLLGVRLAEQDASAGQQIDVKRGSCEVRARQSLQPLSDFWFQLDTTPAHSIDAMGSCD